MKKVLISKKWGISFDPFKLDTRDPQKSYWSYNRSYCWKSERSCWFIQYPMQILFTMHSVYCQVKKNKNGSSQYALWIDSNKMQSLNKKMKTCYLFFRTFGGWSFFFCQCVQKMFILLCIEIKSIEKYLITQKKLMVVLTCMGHLQPRLMTFFKKTYISIWFF